MSPVFEMLDTLRADGQLKPHDHQYLTKTYRRLYKNLNDTRIKMYVFAGLDIFLLYALMWLVK